MRIFPAPDVAPASPMSAGMSKNIPQALAIGLEQDRERAVARRHRQQIRGAFRAAATTARAWPGRRLGQQQRAGGVLAELRGEQRGGAQAGARPAPALRRDPAAAAAAPAARPRQETCTTNPSSPQSVSTSIARLLADLRRDRHRPRRVNPPAARRQDAHAASRRARRARVRRPPSTRREGRSSPPFDRAGTRSRFSRARASRSCSRVSWSTCRGR